MAKRGPGRPRKDGKVRDDEGNLVDPATLERDIPEEEPESPDVTAVQSANAGASAAANNDVIEEMRRELAALRAQVGELPKRAVPDGTWNVNYKAEHLRVHGGVEVQHPPGFRPLPPSSIPRYKAVGGGTTDHIDAPVMRYPKTNEFGQPVLGDDGNQLFTEVPIGKAAQKDERGQPVLTDEYKYWLFVRQTGDRLEGNVMSDIAMGKGIPKDATYDQPDLSAAGISQ